MYEEIKAEIERRIAGGEDARARALREILVIIESLEKAEETNRVLMGRITKSESIDIESLEKERPKGYDEAYLQKKIDLAKKSWEGVNVDEYMNEVRGEEPQDYSGLTDFERAIHRGFLCAGIENVPVAIIKETAQDCLNSLEKEQPKGLDPRYGSRKQEQSEEDIRKELDRLELMGSNDARDIQTIARHFYELGCRHTAVLYDDIEKERQRRQEEEQPKGLDGAAEEAINKAYPGDAYYYVGRPARRLFKEGFKAGAKWMAEQGETIETEVYESYTGKPSIEEIPESFSIGDKVIVQIRKKD